MDTGLLLLAIFTAAFTMIAKRLSSTILTAPMLFIGFGFLLSKSGLMPLAHAEEILHVVAEVALILLLFLDAAQINLQALRKRFVWPKRMLFIGLPLSILIGTGATWLILPNSWPLAALALVAALLAPTDAALGQPVVSNTLVPERVRRGLIVESGLNDGLALPVVLLFACLAAEATGQDGRNWLLFGALQLILGPLVGVAIGYVGAKLLLAAQEREWTAAVYEGIGAMALAASAYLAAAEVGGNGFIAAFVGGLTFGNVVKGRCKFIFEFNESEGQLLAWSAFFLLGLALVPEALERLTPEVLAYILVSLVLVRPASIWLSLLGTDASALTKMFFGWFGPR
jgi:NhaP-type Na+/H+ or K+/H+ antiporter